LEPFLFAILPFSVYYGRSILPDPSTAASILAGIYFFDLWINENVKKNKRFLFFILTIIFTAVAFLLKPFAVFFILPMIFLAFQKLGKKMFINPYLWIFAIVSLIPFVGWRMWMGQFPEGIPSSMWLFNGGEIRFKGAFFNCRTNTR
jgi:4-amino-4-deoxy-L-arabinose transferase-like glycosyltransferase